MTSTMPRPDSPNMDPYRQPRDVPFGRDAVIADSLTRINHMVTHRRELLHDEHELGAWGMGAMAVGCTVDEAVEVSQLLAVSEGVAQEIGESRYLAGAVFARELMALEGATISETEITPEPIPRGRITVGVSSRVSNPDAHIRRLQLEGRL